MSNKFNPYRRKFSPAFFSKGTIAVVKAYSHSDGKVIDAVHIKLEVQKLSKNTPDNYVITGKPMAHIWYTPKENAEPETYSILNVLEITHRAPGVAMIDNGDDSAFFKEFWEVENYLAIQYGWIKHPSYYDVSAFDDLVMYVSNKYMKPDELVNHEKLVGMIFDTHIVKVIEPTKTFDGPHRYHVSKKKLHQVVKRLIPKCRMKAYTAQEEYDGDIMKSMNALDSIPRAVVIFDDADKYVPSGYRDYDVTADLVASDDTSDSPFIPGMFSFPPTGEDGKPIKLCNSAVAGAFLESPAELTRPKDKQGNPPSLGDLLKQKFARMEQEQLMANAEKHIPREGDEVMEYDGSLKHRQELISEVVKGLPETVKFTRDDLKSRLIPYIGDDELLLVKFADNDPGSDEMLSDKTTYIDDGETEEGNFTSDPNKKD